MADAILLILSVSDVSLSAPTSTSVLLPAARWVASLLTGSLAAIFATLAVAAIGLSATFGRLDMRRAVTAVIGCFVLFGAAGIARGLLSHDAPVEEAIQPLPLPPKPIAGLPRPEIPPPRDDPFAGAAVPR